MIADIKQKGMQSIMPKGKNQKYKMYYLAQIMLRKTDMTHYLSLPEIIKELEHYDVFVSDRKTLYDDLKELSRFGIYVEGETNGRSYHYHVISQKFDLPELKLLVDAIQSSKFITANKSYELIKKLEGLVSEYEAQTLQRQVFVSNRIKTMNESIYYNVDVIHNAIAENQKIEFQYFKWNTKKQMELRHDGKMYCISPWGLSWDSENYYLIGYDSKAKHMKHYRVDKMLNISISKEKREGREAFGKLDMASYTQKSFGMFGGEEQKVRLLMHNSLAGVVIDRFGKDVMIIPYDEEHFKVTVDVQVSDQFFAWVFALGENAKIIGPQNVLDQAKNIVSRLNRQYL